MVNRISEQAKTECVSSSSSRFTPNWDVFLSFRDEDTRRNFTGHLYTALNHGGVRTFMDDSELQRGKDTSKALLSIMQEMKVCIVVFSTNYASSKWCLDVLVKIMECKKTMGKLVLPVFYKVDPRDVLQQAVSFADAYIKVSQHSEDQMDLVNKWRAAVTEAVTLSGFHLDVNGYEDKLIQRVVERVLTEVRPMYVDVAKHLVGIESRVRELQTLLKLEIDDIRMVGIFGMCGIGKTTLAKAIFNEIYRCFEGYCFLANVRKLSKQPNGLIRLQEQVLSDILKTTDQVTIVDAGVNLMEERLCCKKVLIVLDDVDDVDHLDSLAGIWKRFAPGSRILLTTRDVHLLDQGQVNLRYEVKKLDRNESLELFSQQAFGQTIPLKVYKDLSNRFAGYIGGVPLALEILGAFLFMRHILEWKSCYEKLLRIPHPQIQEVMISFGALDDDNLKDIFLDIACFFVGMDSEEATRILNSCGFFSENKINMLRKRYLVAVDKSNKLGMYDLIQDMAREMIRKESPEEPGKRSRLWCLEDITNVLKAHKGTEEIEAIIPANTDKWVPEPLHLNTKTFERMRKLRCLRLGNTRLTGSFGCLFDELRWLCWKYCTLKYLPWDFNAPKLVILDLSCSNLELLWEGVKFLENLKILKLNWSHSLLATPDFTGVPMLERLELDWCSNLLEIHPSIGLLDRLVYLDLHSCKSLKILPSTICNLRSLEELNLSTCTGLESLPEELGNMESLLKLGADRTMIYDVPDSIGSLSRLVDLDLEYSKNLQSLPNSICNLKALERLNIKDSFNFKRLPEELGSIECLRELFAGGTAIQTLPTSIGRLRKLAELDLEECWNLENLPSSLCNVSSLVTLNLTGCSMLEGLPDNIGNLESLKELNAFNTTFRNLPDSFGLLSNLKKLGMGITDDEFEMDNPLPIVLCAQGFLPPSISGLSSLEDLYLRNCSLCNKDIPNEIGYLSSLTELVLSDNNYDSLPNSLYHLKKLKFLNVINCTNLQSLPKLPPSLEYLTTINCTSLQTLSNLSNLKSLENFYLENCTSLAEIPGLENLNSVQKLDARGCVNLSLTFLISLIQKCSEAGTTCDIYLPRQDVLDWFTHQRPGPSICFNIPLNVRGIYTGMAFWVDYGEIRGEIWERRNLWAIIKNLTNGTEWKCHERMVTLKAHSWVHVVPKMELGVNSGDRIEVRFSVFRGLKVQRCAVRVVYKPKEGIIGNDIVGTSSGCKRMKCVE